MKTRVLIVDDEPLAREGVAIRLFEYPDFIVVGEGASGAEALSLIEYLEPDLIFLDIQMPDMTGIEVLRKLPPERIPAVIFLTAFDEYAVAAFQVQALDYLLKPLEDDRFDLSVRRARRQLDLQEQNGFRERVIEMLQMQADDSASQCVKRLAVRMGSQVSFVRAADIDWIEGNGDFASLHIGKRTHLLRQSLQSLEARLNPAEFVRVHRSAIVQIDRVAHVETLPNRDCRLTLRNGTELRSSRTYSSALWRLLRDTGSSQ